MFGITGEERKIILFLICAALTGLGVNYAVKSSCRLSAIFVQEMYPAKLDINRAGCRELTGLKGIGPSLAERIVAYRNEHGPFRDPQDLKKVKGIGEEKFQAIKDCILSQ